MASIEQYIQNEVPTFLHREIVFCDKFVQQRQQHCIVLARNLKFYKFQRKQLLNCIDLSETCLRKVSQNICHYKGPKGKCFKTAASTRSVDATTKQGGLMETAEMTASNLTEEEASKVDVNVSFGKYNYRNFDINKIYFLIHCWDKLVVINFEDYSFVTEYKDVRHFRIVHGKVKFIAMLELLFENGSTLCTNFQTQENMGNQQDANDDIRNARSNFRQMLERVRCAKAELQLHKSATQKDFDMLQDIETHGCNYVRSPELEEKPMLTRCGDIWTRFVDTNNTLVLGVPLVNNCSASSLTILKNLKPILKANDANTANIFYKYRLYQLSTKFEDMETLETYFQTEEEELNTRSEWANCKKAQLLPASFGVLLLAIKTAEICLLEECPLFLYYEIEKAQTQCLSNTTAKTKIYEQHLLLKNLNMTDLFRQREKHVVSFNSLTCNQDFLACSMLNNETTLYIEFQTHSNALIFEQLLCKNFNFKTHERNMNIQPPSEDLSVAESIKQTQKHIATGICYNNDPTSLWFGSMVVKTTPSTVDDEATLQVWKLYINNQEKAFVCLKSLFNELANCAIKDMKYFVKKDKVPQSDYLDLKNSLTAEIECLKNFNKCVDTVAKKNTLMDLLRVQVDTDLLIANL